MNPTPWKAVRHNPVNVTVQDANGVALATAHQFPPYCDSMETAQLIVEAVNERAALRDMVRQSVETLEQVLEHADMTVFLRETVVEAQREARKALGETVE